MEPLPAVPNMIAWVSFVPRNQQLAETSTIPIS
jgi:hypothetical protein